MQLSLDTYQGCLRTTGGALDGSDKKKCYWYKLNYHHNNKGKIVYKEDVVNNELTMADEKGQRHAV